MPIGFKNGTDGSLQAAANAMLAASQPHHFLGINRQGLASIVTTTGNPDGHLVLRGGKAGPNYDAAHVSQAAMDLMQMGLNSRVMVDCSHDNASKDHTKQAISLNSIAEQVVAGSRHLLGVMLESHLVAGKQAIPKDLSKLVYGQSITDACIDIPTTATLLRTLAQAVRNSRREQLPTV